MEKTVQGLHEFLERDVIPRHAKSPSTSLDVGCGSGAFARRLQRMGFELTACDRTPPTLPDVNSTAVDLDDDGGSNASSASST
ncbi:MAG: methyltransferase domain-containing protein [Actinobacteria bacterium]|nr:methyltransferase domain-containing protein [Actinomycetota bacterium]